MIDKIKAEIERLERKSKYLTGAALWYCLESIKERKECLAKAEETEKQRKNVFHHAWEVLQDNRNFMLSKTNKNPHISERDFEQREDQIGLLYSDMFNISYNKAIEELRAFHSPTEQTKQDETLVAEKRTGYSRNADESLVPDKTAPADMKGEQQGNHSLESSTRKIVSPDIKGCGKEISYHNCGEEDHLCPSCQRVKEVFIQIKDNLFFWLEDEFGSTMSPKQYVELEKRLRDTLKELTK